MNRTTQEFSEKLYDILEDPTNQRYIRWNEAGDTFLIIDTLEFTKNTLDQYFKHKNFNSFIRQLNKYDFHKVKSSEETIMKFGENIWEFKHEFFRRRRKELLTKIVRKKSINERKEEFSDFNIDVAEKSIFLQNQMLNSLKQLSAHFQALTQDIIELKRIIFGDRNLNYTHSAVLYEENLSIKQSITTILQKNGFRVHAIESSSEISGLLLEKKIDLVIISSNFRNYMSFIHSFKKSDPNIPLILTGVSFDRNELLELQRIGVDDVILKPINENSFLKILRKINKNWYYGSENAERSNYYVN
ncbi:heat shock transcription factor [Tubulinosema ratisbonensis]|uniref:Heat shock transcription factor n=1 Tax=Tubulinosema ratisbonensis TaxID=291195 RepID=A0A437AI49_9MICR|nr:heat shock transcription factor [Tubulinosema ratisbonensis]